MKTLIFINQKDTTNNQLSNLCSDLSSRFIDYQILDVDAKLEPIEKQLYDIVSTPTVVVARDDGSVVKTWRHGLPMVDDISYSLGNV